MGDDIPQRKMLPRDLTDFEAFNGLSDDEDEEDELRRYLDAILQLHG